jgi:hypothetical protein
MVEHRHADVLKKMNTFRHVLHVLAIGVPLSALGLWLYLPSLHAAFYPIFLLVPYMWLDGKIDINSSWFFIGFGVFQFFYFAILITIWKKVRLNLMNK